MEKYNEFTNRKKAINKQIKDLKKKKLQVKLDQFTKGRSEVAKKMSTFTAGQSTYPQ